MPISPIVIAFIAQLITMVFVGFYWRKQQAELTSFQFAIRVVIFALISTVLLVGALLLSAVFVTGY